MLFNWDNDDIHRCPYLGTHGKRPLVPGFYEIISVSLIRNRNNWLSNESAVPVLFDPEIFDLWKRHPDLRGGLRIEAVERPVGCEKLHLVHRKDETAFFFRMFTQQTQAGMIYTIPENE